MHIGLFCRTCFILGCPFHLQCSFCSVETAFQVQSLLAQHSTPDPLIPLARAQVVPAPSTPALPHDHVLVSAEKLAHCKLNVAEVTQSEIGQKQKLQTVLEAVQDLLRPHGWPLRWNVDCEWPQCGEGVLGGTTFLSFCVGIEHPIWPCG